MITPGRRDGSRHLKDGRVAEDRVLEVRLLTRPAPRHGEEPRGQRLVQSEGERGDVEQQRLQLLGRHVAGHGDGVQPEAAHGGVEQHVVQPVRPLVRAPRQPGVLERREHQPRVPAQLHAADRLERAGDERG
eukprot:CAMPEP_0195623558 /NCGR_PEP_ID=MMETSP0815-20121206/16821_1 /TAXON_ID=97485 /ORGANISM="Prymnesium parvum, Strain Texoma1" /LENGTH=131 /DNA_ID=CAMNT_0040764451 /DNA_START=408 /DNA_END=800 /DNA_ORIENTATION=+